MSDNKYKTDAPLPEMPKPIEPPPARSRRAQFTNEQRFAQRVSLPKIDD